MMTPGAIPRTSDAAHGQVEDSLITDQGKQGAQRRRGSPQRDPSDVSNGKRVHGATIELV